jgi:hypothetical protein
MKHDRTGQDQLAPLLAPWVAWWLAMPMGWREKR